LTNQHDIWYNAAYWPSEPYRQLKFQTFKNSSWQTAASASDSFYRMISQILLLTYLLP